MSRSPIVISVVLLVAALGPCGCQGGENLLPLPPPDASADAKRDGASSEDAAGDAATRKDAKRAEAEAADLEGGDAAASR